MKMKALECNLPNHYFPLSNNFSKKKIENYRPQQQLGKISLYHQIEHQPHLKGSLFLCNDFVKLICILSSFHTDQNWQSCVRTFLIDGRVGNTDD